MNLIVNRFFRAKIIRKKIQRKSSYVNASNRKLAVTLDDYKCRNCGTTVHPENNNGDGAHHIIFKSEYVNDNLNNLITLCFSCHRFAHDGYNSYTGERLTARQFIIILLEDLENKENFRWGESLEALKRKRK